MEREQIVEKRKRDVVKLYEMFYTLIRLSQCVCLVVI
jgi:hypothetical protein